MPKKINFELLKLKEERILPKLKGYSIEHKGFSIDDM